MQLGYRCDWVPGPVHQLEQRIVQWQQLYQRLLAEAQLNQPSLRSQSAIN